MSVAALTVSLVLALTTSAFVGCSVSPSESRTIVLHSDSGRSYDVFSKETIAHEGGTLMVIKFRATYPDESQENSRATGEIMDIVANEASSSGCWGVSILGITSLKRPELIFGTLYVHQPEGAWKRLEGL